MWRFFCNQEIINFSVDKINVFRRFAVTCGKKYALSGFID